MLLLVHRLNLQPCDGHNLQKASHLIIVPLYWKLEINIINHKELVEHCECDLKKLSELIRVHCLSKGEKSCSMND